MHTAMNNRKEITLFLLRRIVTRTSESHACLLSVVLVSKVESSRRTKHKNPWAFPTHFRHLRSDLRIDVICRRPNNLNWTHRDRIYVLEDLSFLLWAVRYGSWLSVAIHSIRYGKSLPHFSLIRKRRLITSCYPVGDVRH